MPKFRFTRTPTAAEGGPGHEFFEGTIHEISPKSLRRWLDLGCGEEINDEFKPEILVARPVEGEIDYTKFHKETIEKFPTIIAALKESEDEEKNEEKKPEVIAEVNQEFEAIEAGGEAPPIIVPKLNVPQRTGPRSPARPPSR